MNRISRTLAVLAALAFSASAFAQGDYPSRPIEMLVGFAPAGGAPADFEAFLGSELAKYGTLAKDAKISIE